MKILTSKIEAKILLGEHGFVSPQFFFFWWGCSREVGDIELNRLVSGGYPPGYTCLAGLRLLLGAWDATIGKCRRNKEFFGLAAQETRFICDSLAWNDLMSHISSVKLATLFSIATTPRSWGGRNSFPWITPLYPWSLPYNARR